MDLLTGYARSLGKLPDRYWYQLNGQSAQENWMEQRQTIYERLTAQEDEEIIIMSKNLKTALDDILKDWK